MREEWSEGGRECGWEGRRDGETERGGREGGIEGGREGDKQTEKYIYMSRMDTERADASITTLYCT